MALAGEIVGSRLRTGLLAAAAALAFVTALLLGAPAPAHAVSWLLPPGSISGAGPEAVTPRVAVAGDGTATVVWRDAYNGNDKIQVATRPAGSTSFGPPQTISLPDSPNSNYAYDPRIAVAPDGKTTVVWQNTETGVLLQYSIQAAVRPAGQDTFGGPQEISDRTVDTAVGPPDVAAAPDGTTTVVWPGLSNELGSSPTTYETVARAATLPAGSNDFPDPSSVPPAALSTASRQADPWFTAVGVGPDGTATAAWAQAISPGGGTIQTSTRVPGQSSWSSPQDLSDPTVKSEAPSVAVGQGGRAAVMWQVGGVGTIEAATRASGTAAFGASQLISDPDPLQVPNYSQQVEMGPAGEAVAVWYGGNPFRAWSGTLQAGASSFDLPTAVSPGGARSASIAIAPDGEQTMVWYSRSGSTNAIQAASRSGTSSAWSDPVTLVSYDAPVWAGPEPSVAVAPSGAATAVWAQSNSGGSTRIIQTVSSSPTTYDLSTSKSGDGSGTITSAPAGISCGATCSSAFELSSSVTLTATPEKGSSFGGWGGACSGSSATCTVTILGNRSATATFTKDAPGPTPSNRFTIASTSASGSMAVTRVRVPGAGKLSQRGSYRTRGAGSSATRTACTASRTAKKAGTYTLKCRLDAAARRQREKGRLRVVIRTTFTPTGGTARSSLRTIVFGSLKPRYTG
jgi:hypothetical protein